MAEVLAGTVVGAEGFARPVAIKRMLPALSVDAAFGEMFRNEARLAALLHHPNIAAVLDFDRDEDGSYFIVMELVPGVDLRKLLGTGALPPAGSASIIADVLRALAYAHELEHQGKPLRIIHRDISPHNVMVSWDGAAKVVDFGIAKAVAATNASRSGTLKGKVGYMSPEQAHGDMLDGRSDLFAVGVMFHEMLTGRRLFAGATEPEVLARLLTQPIPPPSQVNPAVPADLEQVCMRMLERDRNARYKSCRRALEALIGCASFSARAALDLQALLAARFPAEAPRRAIVPGSVAPADVGTPTVAGHRQSQQTRTAGASGATRTGTGVGKVYWVAGGLGFAVAAAVVIVLLSSGSSGGEPKAEVEPEAGPVAAVSVADAAVAVPDAAAVLDAAVPDAAAPDAGAVKRAQPKGSGTLTVIVKPWGQVWVDGKDHGMAPTTLSLPAGKHKVRMKNGDLGREETAYPVVKAGETVTVRREWKAPGP